MAQTHNKIARELTKLVPVRTLNDLDWLVKESELMTGEPGREFVVAGADRPAYRVEFDCAGYQIQRVDDKTGMAMPQHATAPELVRHALGNALACGLLYTAALH